VRAIATPTFLAGLSGPVFTPVTGLLVEAARWRSATALLGLALAAVGGAVAPLLLGRAPRLPFPAADAMTGVPGRALRDRRFLLFTLAAVLGYGALEAVIVHRVARFAEAGFPVATVTAWADDRPGRGARGRRAPGDPRRATRRCGPYPTRADGRRILLSRRASWHGDEPW
jgi:hypothetical protein